MVDPAARRDSAADATQEPWLSDLERIMWAIERDPLLHSAITVVVVLAGAPDPTVARARIERAVRRIPRLRQRIAATACPLVPPRWEPDPDFDLDRHLRWLHVPGDDVLTATLTVAAPIAGRPFDTARPLWGVSFVQSSDPGRTAVVARFHHALTDGAGAVILMDALFDAWPRPPDDRELDEPPLSAGSPGAGIGDALRHEAQHHVALVGASAAGLRRAALDPRDTARHVAATIASAARVARPVARPLSPVLRGRSSAVELRSLTVPLGRLKRAGAAVDGTLNDAYVTAVCRGLAHYHERLGSPVGALRMGLPLGAQPPGAPAAVGNQFAPARLVVPVATVDVAAHVRAVGNLIRAQRTEPALALFGPLSAAVTRLPGPVLLATLRALLHGQDFLASNVRGVPVPLSFAGCEVLSISPHGPPGGTAVNVTLFSYRGTAHIGITADTAAVTDTGALAECLALGLDEVAALADARR